MLFLCLLARTLNSTRSWRGISKLPGIRAMPARSANGPHGGLKLLLACTGLQIGGRDNEPTDIELRWSKLKESREHLARCTLAGAQFFQARKHGFTNWPKFARHVEELARSTRCFRPLKQLLMRLSTVMRKHCGICSRVSQGLHVSVLPVSIVPLCCTMSLPTVSKIIARRLRRISSRSRTSCWMQEPRSMRSLMPTEDALRWV